MSVALSRWWLCGAMMAAFCVAPDAHAQDSSTQADEATPLGAPGEPESSDNSEEAPADADPGDKLELEQATARHHVIGVDGRRLMVDVIEDVVVGDVVHVWRRVRVQHPVTGEVLDDRYPVGAARILRVGKSMMVATMLGEGELADIMPGDAVEVPKAVEKKPSRVALSPHGKDRDAALVEVMWLRLKGTSLKKRVLTYEAFVVRYPTSRFAAVLWEEAQALRELILKRKEPTLPAPPPKPSVASTRLASESAFAYQDASAVDFAALEKQLGNSAGGDDKSRTAPDPDVKADSCCKHDGGFIRFGYGPQWFNGALESRMRPTPSGASVPAEVDVTGFALTSELLFGGAPAPGFVLAARFALTVALEPELELSELNDGFTDEAMDTIVIPYTGILMDLYPDPELGVHVFATVGMTMADISGSGQVGAQSFFGLGYGGGIGFEGWIADEWSLGVQLRLDGAYMVGEQTKVDDEQDTLTLVNPGAQMAFTFN